MTPETFDALFDTFRHTVARLETLPAYDVGGAEAARIRAFRDGTPRPERSVRTDPWLARIAATTAVGKRWTRVRVVDEPLTDYQRYQLESYRESQAVGEQVSLVPRSLAHDNGPDFWLFDHGHESAHAVLMSYDDAGHWLGADLVDDADVVANLARRREGAALRAEPLNVFLAGTRG